MASDQATSRGPWAAIGAIGTLLVGVAAVGALFLDRAPSEPSEPVQRPQTQPSETPPSNAASPSRPPAGTPAAPPDDSAAPSPAQRAFRTPDVLLRSSPRELEIDAVAAMLRTRGFSFHTDLGDLGASMPGTVRGRFENDFEQRTIEGERVVIDHATGLMWQHATSGQMNQADASQYLATINRTAYAGFTDWRLPTVEEGASLIMAQQQNHGRSGFYMAAVFDASKHYFLTADRSGSRRNYWKVHCNYGNIGFYSTTVNVKAVRSLF